MKIRCKLSGVNFEVQNFANTQIQGIHPLFSCDILTHMTFLPDWRAGRLTEDECRVLFCSMLYQTELVDFRTTPVPKFSTIQNNMEHLFQVLTWLPALTNVRKTLPSYVITHTTRHLANISVILNSWDTEKLNWREGYAREHARARAAQKEDALLHLIRDSSKKTRDYATQLGKWALEASDAPTVIRDSWLKLFQLKGLEVYGAKTAELSELLDWMVTRLQHGTSQAHTVLKHLRYLVAESQRADFGIGIDQDNPYIILEDTVESQNRQRIAASAPLEMPVKENYDTQLAYLRAKAAYNIAASEKAKQEQALAKLQKDNALDYPELEEDDDISNLGVDNV